MRTAPLLPLALMLCLFVSCSHSKTEPTTAATDAPAKTGEAVIVRAWHGDYPVSQLGRLPDDQRTAAVGVIVDRIVFNNLWQAFQPGEPLPEVDFNHQLVLFARNTQFYNRIRIGRVTVVDGVADVLAMETKSAMPIENKVAMSLVLVPREGIRAIRSGDDIRSIE